MRIACGFDHGGFPLSETVFETLDADGHEVLDLGATSYESGDDYPDFALAVCRAIVAGEAERGMLVCGSGAGVAVAANKVEGIRAAMAHDTYTAAQCVEHDDCNVLALGRARDRPRDRGRARRRLRGRRPSAARSATSAASPRSTRSSGTASTPSSEEP